MSSWALVADVWYLPSMTKHDDEDGIQFAQRVKTCIARRGGLIDSVWDGQLKRMKVKKEKVEEKQRELGQVFGWKNMQVIEDEEEVIKLEENKCVTEEEVEVTKLEENKYVTEEVTNELKENKSATEEVTTDAKLEECVTEESSTKTDEKDEIETAVEIKTETEEITSDSKPEVGYVMIEENTSKTEEECKNDAEDILNETKTELINTDEKIEENSTDTTPSDEQSVKNVTFSLSNEPSCVETQ